MINFKFRIKPRPPTPFKLILCVLALFLCIFSVDAVSKDVPMSHSLVMAGQRVGGHSYMGVTERHNHYDRLFGACSDTPETVSVTVVAPSSDPMHFNVETVKTLTYEDVS